MRVELLLSRRMPLVALHWGREHSQAEVAALLLRGRRLPFHSSVDGGAQVQDLFLLPRPALNESRSVDECHFISQVL